MTIANKECSIQIGMMMFLQLQNLKGVNTKEVGIEIKGNKVEIK